MTAKELEARSAVIACALAMDAAGFSPNKSGNVSCRDPGGMLITPSALPYASLKPEDLVVVGLDGTIVEGVRRPSSEWAMHAAVYRARPEAGGIVHTHSPHATALSETGGGLPAIHYMIALAGGSVRCAPYATFGTERLAENAVAALLGRRAVLLANHGVLALGSNVNAAFSIATEVENLARQYLSILAAGLTPVLLDDAELDRVQRKLADYERSI